MPLNTVKIPLTKPIIDHGGPIMEIELREPTLDEYLQLGEPYEVAESAEGARFAVQNADVIRRYLEICLIKPSTPELLGAAGIRAGRKVRAAILGFFRDGDEAGETSETSPTNSSSAATPASTPDRSGTSPSAG